MKNLESKRCRDYLVRILATALALLLLLTTVLPVTVFAEEEEDEGSDIGKITSDFPETFSLTEWMSLIPGYYKLSQLNIPGAHDAGTTNVKLFIPVSKCQNWYIDEQLDNGLRFLDIRVNFQSDNLQPGEVANPDSNGDPLILCHGPSNGKTRNGDNLELEKHVMPIVEKFVKDHPSETIIFKVTDEHTSDHGVSVQKYLRENLIPRLDPDIYIVPDFPSMAGYNGAPEVMTLAEARGHVIFLMDGTLTKYEDHYENMYASSKEKYLEHWMKTSPAMELGAADTFIKQGYLENMGDAGTREGNPDVKLVSTNTTGITKGSNKSIKEYAADVNKWFIKQDMTQNIRYGWIFMDFPKAEQIKRIIRTNPTYSGDIFNWYVTDDGTLHIKKAGSDSSEDLSSHIVGSGELTSGTHFVQAKDCLWRKYRDIIKSVVVENEIHPIYTSYWFNDLTFCKYFDLENLKTDKTVDMRNMFSNCVSLKTLDITSFTRGSLTNADSVNVTEMFAGDTNLLSIYADPKLDYSNVTKNDKMFYQDTNLTGQMGTKCDGTEKLVQYAKMDTETQQGFFSEKEDVHEIYWGISSDGVLYISHHGDEKTPNLLEVDPFHPPKWCDEPSKIKAVVVTEWVEVYSTNYWFYDLRNVTKFDLGSLDLSKCDDMIYMFAGCSSVETLDLSGWAKSVPCSFMFDRCTSLKTIYVDPKFSMEDQTESKNIFRLCNNLVGQNGTTYDSSYDDRDYMLARIDGAGDGDGGAPGYFTVRPSDLWWGFDELTSTLYLGGEISGYTPNSFVDMRYIWGEFSPWYFAYKDKVKSVKVVNPMSPVHMSGWFQDFVNCTTFDLKLLDTSKTTEIGRPV